MRIVTELATFLNRWVFCFACIFLRLSEKIPSNEAGSVHPCLIHALLPSLESGEHLIPIVAHRFSICSTFTCSTASAIARNQSDWAAGKLSTCSGVHPKRSANL
jgi:hypothetical protein